MAKQKQKQTKTEVKQTDKKAVGTRGRVFEGTVIKKFPQRIVIEYNTTVFVKKYERFYKKHSKIHAMVPKGIDVNIGDYIQIKECRPLSKIIHHMVVKKIRSVETGDKK